MLHIICHLPLSEYAKSSRWLAACFVTWEWGGEDGDKGEADGGGRVSNSCFKLSLPEAEIFDDEVTNCGRTFPIPFKWTISLCLVTANAATALAAWTAAAAFKPRISSIECDFNIAVELWCGWSCIPIPEAVAA